MWRGRILLFFVKVKGHLRSQYLKLGTKVTLHTWCVDALYQVEDTYHFWQRSKVIKGFGRSDYENLVNPHISRYETWMFFIFGMCMHCVKRKNHIVLVGAKGQLGSSEVKL